MPPTNQDVINKIKLINALEDKKLVRLYFFHTHRISNSIHNKKFWVEKMYENDNGDVVMLDISKGLVLSGDTIILTDKIVAGLKYSNGKLVTWGTKPTVSYFPSNKIAVLLNHYNREWVLGDYFETSSSKWLRYATRSNSILQRVLNGKITNPDQLMTAWLRTNPSTKKLKIGHYGPIFARLIKNDVHGIQEIADMLQYAKDIDKTMARLSQVKTNKDLRETFPFFSYKHMGDLCRQLSMLGHKIDPSWSHTRLDSCHYDWSIEMADLQRVIDPTTLYNYTNTNVPDAPCDLRLITNSIELSAEGSVMGHCIGSYSDSSSTRTLFHFHGELSMPFSLAVGRSYRGKIDGKKEYNFHISQMYGVRNRSLPQEDHEIIEEWLAKPSVNSWFANEIKAYEEGETEITIIPPKFSLDSNESARPLPPPALNIADDEEIDDLPF